MTATEEPPLQTMEEVRTEAEEQGYRYCYGSLFAPNYNSKGQMVSPMHDWQIEAHCLRAQRPWEGFATVEEGERPSEYQGYVAHFMAFISALWPMFEWNPNAAKICKELFVEDRKFLGVAGHASCVAGSTRLLNPITGQSPTIKELCDSGINPCVMTLSGPKIASVPFKKSRRSLFEVRLSNGRKFRCTGTHRVLTEFGWTSVDELIPGDDLLGYEPSLQGSTLEPSPLVHGQGAHHCSGTVGDSRCRYSTSPCLYGEQLQSARDAARDDAPSPVDAHEHDLSPSLRKGDRERGQSRNRLHQSISLSTHDADGLCETSGKRALHCSSPRTFELLGALFLQSSQSASLNGHLSPFSGPTQRSGRTHNKGCAADLPAGSSRQPDSGCTGSFLDLFQCDLPQAECSSESRKDSQPSGSSPDFCSTSYGWTVQKERVLSIRKVGTEDFYDLNVPGEHHYFAEGAIHHNSGKSEALAYFAVAFFLIDPKNTMCIVTSKTVEIAQKKIWGSVRRAWNQLKMTPDGKGVIPEKYLPGELTQKAITYIDVTTGDQDPQRGLMLMPGEQSQYKKSADKYQGMKAPNLMVAADELATLSPAIVETAISNLTKNANFKFIGAFNPETHYDASRRVAMPTKGWGSISEKDFEWETELGYCIRFDGTRSPNVLDPAEPWTGLYNREDLKRDYEFYHGDKTAGFWTMVRGFWPPMGIEDAIYSSQEIEMYRGEAPLPGQPKGFFWLQEPIRLAGLDPAYRPGGDAAALYFAQLGRAKLSGGKHGENGPEVLLFCYGDPLGPLESPGFLILAEDVTKSQDKPRQVAEALKRECERRSIRIENVGIDITGAASFGSLVRMVWGDGFLEVDFSQSPSDTPISDTDPRTAKERYADRPSELWYSGKYLLWTEQLKGISPELAQDMVNRSFEESHGKVKIESKETMKQRIGRSPDKGDGAFVCLDVARQRHGLTSVAKPIKTKEQLANDGGDDAFMKWAKEMHVAGRPGMVYQGPRL